MLSPRSDAVKFLALREGRETLGGTDALGTMLASALRPLADVTLQNWQEILLTTNWVRRILPKSRLTTRPIDDLCVQLAARSRC